MDFELKAAKQKWEREQRERKESARIRLERDRRAREQAARQQEALEEAQRLRRIEAAEIAALAERQEQEDLELGDGVRYKTLLRATRLEGDGDKITLPASDFEKLSSQNAIDKGPMYFEMSFGESVTHCGVLMFTAPEGTVGLPLHVWQNLGPHLTELSNVRVRYVRLPKGNYAKLQPEGLDFADVPNHKAVLETKLRHHATLSQGDVLRLNHGGADYRLRVLELKPEPSVSVLETDIEVDVVGTLASDGQEKIVLLKIGKAEAGVVEEGAYKYFKFSVDPHLVEAVRKGDAEVSVELRIDGRAGSDADIYVASHPVLFPSRDQHQWASHNSGTKIIRMTDDMTEGGYSIAVYGFRGLSNFTLSVEAKSKSAAESSGQKLGGATSEEQLREGYEKCSNCKQMIPSRTIPLHEAYCRRHNKACSHPGCGVVLLKEEANQHVHCAKCGEVSTADELAKHMIVFHEPLTCTCGAVLEMREMVKHKTSACPHRRITCQFCGDMVEAGGDALEMRDKIKGLSQHESSCGSRTDECSTCHRPVMLKEMSLHVAAVHAAPSTASSMDFEHTGPSSMIQEINCLVCGMNFEGVDAEKLLSNHLDAVHFVAKAEPAGPSNAEMSPPADVTPAAVTVVEDSTADSGAAATAAVSHRRSLSVLCPICGMAVHSERDLSWHIDLVH